MYGFILLALLVLLSACSSQQLHIQAWVDPVYKPTIYKSFSVSTKLVDERYGRVNTLIQNAIKRDMQTKGFRYSPAESRADLLVLFLADVHHEEQLQSEIYPTTKGVFSRYQMVSVNEGSLLINVIDQRTNKVIWKGSALRDLYNFRPEQLTQERVNLRIEELMESLSGL